jgi:hypothetical protein
LQIRMWAVAWRATAFAFALFVHAHGDLSAPGEAGEKLKEWVVGLEVIERVAAKACDEKDRGVFTGSFRSSNDCLIVDAIGPDRLVQRARRLGEKREGEDQQEKSFHKDRVAVPFRQRVPKKSYR